MDETEHVATVSVEYADGRITIEMWPAYLVNGAWQFKAPRTVTNVLRMTASFPPLPIADLCNSTPN